MLTDNIDFMLKDGRKATLRNPKDADIPGTLEYLKVSAGETDFLLRNPEECDRYTPEGEKALFDRINNSSEYAMLVCEVDGELAGNCEICWDSGMKTRHRASVAIALLKKFWGQGIGTKMFEALIGIAEKNPDIIQIELDYIEGNSRARALYEKMGFRITGVKPNAIRLKDGTLLNEISMVREIKR